MTSVDVVMVAYRSDDVIAGAVDRARSLGGTVVVVDNGDGGSARLAAAMGALAIHDPSNPGFGAGQNRGVSFTDSEFVLLCNPDADLRPGAVVEGAAYLDAHPSVAAVQGVIVNRATGQPERSAGLELRPVHLLGRAVGARRLLASGVVWSVAARVPAVRDHAERIPAGPVEVESLAATTLLVRRSAFDSVRGFDESIFLYGEDQDLCHRLRLAGWTLVAVPEVWAEHVSGGSSASSVARELSWWQGTMRYAARWWGAGAWSAAMAAASLRTATLVARHPSLAGQAVRTILIGPARARRAGAWVA